VQHGTLPAGLTLRRTTDELDATSVPAALLRSHRIAPTVWGVLEVTAGTVAFVWEDQPDIPVVLASGDSMVIPPGVLHHVEPGPDARLRVSFHR
jgi:cupin 2 domain-containing protein